MVDERSLKKDIFLMADDVFGVDCDGCLWRLGSPNAVNTFRF